MFRSYYRGSISLPTFKLVEGAGLAGSPLSLISPTPYELVIHRYGTLGRKPSGGIKYYKIFFRPF